MRETTIQAAIQAKIQSMAEFADADVVINDWSLLDQSSLAAPYVIISNAVGITARKDTAAEQVTYGIPITLIERFTNWKPTLDNLRTRREAIFNAYAANDNARSAGGLEGVTIDVIRTDGPEEPYFDRGLSAEQQAVALPVFIQQTLVLDVEEF